MTGVQTCALPILGQTNRPEIYFARSYDVLIYARRGNATLYRPGASNVLDFRPEISERLHEVEKPLPLMDELIQRFCLPGHVVLDPFAGSGTTIVAALKWGCNPIGFENDIKRYNVALTRIAAAIKLKDAGQSGLVK